MLISFEGIDGSGKTTQIELLRTHLENKGHTVRIYREPGGTEISEEIRSILLDSDLDIDPVTELLLFSAARSQLVAEKVIPELNKGYIVILDRYYDSTIAYQGYGRKSVDIDRIHEINAIASHQKAPDLTIYLRLDPKNADKRTASQIKDRMEKSGESFFADVYEGFEKLAKSADRIKTVNANRKPEVVHREITDIVNSLI